MPNKTIYISDSDASLFDEAKTIAGESLSSVISRALREFVAKNKKKADGMKEITVKVGKAHVSREQRFVGAIIEKWSGFSDDKKWWMEAKIYKTQKGNLAVNLVTVARSTVVTNPGVWKASGDYLTNVWHSELIVAEKAAELQGKLPNELYEIVENISKKDETPVEFLDI
jgi:EXLDI family protein